MLVIVEQQGIGDKKHVNFYFSLAALSVPLFIRIETHLLFTIQWKDKTTSITEALIPQLYTQNVQT